MLISYTESEILVFTVSENITFGKQRKNRRTKKICLQKISFVVP